jgi:ATP-dependent RNA helicase DeaD
VAISLVNLVEKAVLDRIAREFSISFEQRTIPSDEDVAVVVAERMTALLEARLRLRDKLQTERSHRFAPLARSLAENEEESPIITMLLDDYYQQTLHAPVLQPSDTSSPEKDRRPMPARNFRRRR